MDKIKEKQMAEEEKKESFFSNIAKQFGGGAIAVIAVSVIYYFSGTTDGDVLGSIKNSTKDTYTMTINISELVDDLSKLEGITEEQKERVAKVKVELEKVKKQTVTIAGLLNIPLTPTETTEPEEGETPPELIENDS
jgi:hypothetical protein